MKSKLTLWSVAAATVFFVLAVGSSAREESLGTSSNKKPQAVVVVSTPVPAAATIRKGKFMAISFRSSSTSSNGTISKPPGTVDGDVMVAFVGMSSDDTIPTPAGWTFVRRNGTNGSQGSGALATFYKIAASEGASYTFDVSRGPNGCVIIVSYSGVDPSGVINVERGGFLINGSVARALTVTTTAPNTTLVTGHFVRANTTLTTPSGMTERAFEKSSPSGISMKVFDEDRAVAGATGNRDSAHGSSAPYPGTSGQAVVLNPGSVAPMPPNANAGFMAAFGRF